MQVPNGTNENKVCLHAPEKAKRHSFAKVLISHKMKVIKVSASTAYFLDCGKATHVGRTMSDFKKTVVVGECFSSIKVFSVMKLACN